MAIENRKVNWPDYFLGAISIIALSYLAIILWLYFVKPYLPFIDKYLIIPTQISPKDIKSSATVSELINTGKIVSIADFYGHIVSYYNTLITILIALLGIVSFFGYMYVKGESEEVSTEKAIKHVDTYLENKLPGLLDKKVKDGDAFRAELEEMQEKVSGLENQIEFLLSKFPEQEPLEKPNGNNQTATGT